MLILDDVFAELDRLRRARLAEPIGRLRAGHRDRGGGKTCPLPLSARIVRVEAGRILEADGCLSTDRD